MEYQTLPEKTKEKKYRSGEGKKKWGGAKKQRDHTARKQKQKKGVCVCQGGAKR